jgi:hypothetical protein
MVGIQTGTMLVSSELSNSVLMNWDADYPNKNKFKTPQDYKLETVNTDQNCVVARDQLQDCEYLSNLVTSFKEEYIWLEVQSVWLIWKLKEGNGFQDWHQDLVNNGQTVYTVVVNLGSLELQAVAGEISNLNVDNYAYAPDVEAISPFNNSDRDDEGVTDGDDEGEAKEQYVSDSEGEAKQASVGDEEGEAKQASVARSLKYSNDEDYIDNVNVDSDKEFHSSFPRDRNSRDFIVGGPQRPDMMGMTPVEEEAAMNKYRKEKMSFTDKSRLSLMKSMASTLLHYPRRFCWDVFWGIRMRWFDQWWMWNLIVCHEIIPFN